MQLMTPEPLILAVDDETGILALMRLGLPHEGFRVITTNNALEAQKLAREQTPDLILLDVSMPHISGLELLRDLREWTPIPVILVTGLADIKDRVAGLDMGADDYVVKPFGLQELGARIRAVLRRTTVVRPHEPFKIDNLEVDLQRRMVRRDGRVIPLTPNEWSLLSPFVVHQGTTFSKAELSVEMWKSDSRNRTDSLPVWICRLRHKLEADPQNPTLIQTVPQGYVLALRT